MKTATLHINKLAAAKRQIQAAIRMYFAEEDELAVHIVASAAYNVLKDIKRSRGKSEAADFLGLIAFSFVSSWHRGELPPSLASEKWIADLVRCNPDIGPHSEWVDCQGVTMSTDAERAYWNDTNKIANFLKHADRDTDQLLSCKIHNCLLIVRALAAYQAVAPDDLGVEGFVFRAFCSMNDEIYGSGSDRFDHLVLKLRECEASRRIAFCRELIVLLKADMTDVN